MLLFVLFFVFFAICWRKTEQADLFNRLGVKRNAVPVQNESEMNVKSRKRVVIAHEKLLCYSYAI